MTSIRSQRDDLLPGTAEKTSPSLFPLISCDNSGADITVGCLAKGFLPDTLSFSWGDKSNNSINGIKSFPSLLQSSTSTYIASSQVSVPSASWDTTNPFYCTAKHETNNKVVKIELKVTNGPFRPVISLHPPIKEDVEQNENLTIVCLIRDFSPKDINVNWLRNGHMVDTDTKTEEPVLNSEGRFDTTSYIIISKNDWNSDTVYSCEVYHSQTQTNEIRNVSKSQVCENQNCPAEIQVFTIPPSYESTFETKVAKLTCLVNNMASADDINISWEDSNGTVLKTIMENPTYNNNGTYSIVGIATVCADDWAKGKFVCKVQHPELASLKQVSLFKENGDVLKSPSLYVYPPHPDELAKKETATMSCLVKQFYPRDVFVKWLCGGEEIPKEKYTITNLIEEVSNEKKSYSLYSMLTVQSDDWTSGKSYSCVVGHESLPLQLTQKSLDKSTAKGLAIDVDEETENLWTTASTFMVLFFLSLFYSATVTLFKEILKKFIDNQHLRSGQHLKICLLLLSVEKKQGSIFPLLPCCNLEKVNDVTIGCLYKDFLPDAKSVLWNANINIEKSKSITFPAAKMENSDLYSMSTQLTITSTEWDTATYNCSFDNKAILLSNNMCKVRETFEPSGKILLTSFGDNTKDNMVSLLCIISNFPSEDAKVEWLKNGFLDSTLGPSSRQLKAKDRTFELKVPKASWDEEDLYTCQLSYATEKFMYNVSRCTAFPQNYVEPEVKLEKPSNEDIFDNKAKITCSVSGFNLDPKKISLKLNGKKTDKLPKLNNRDGKNIKVTYDVSRSEWEALDSVSCVVKQPCANPDIEDKKEFKKINAERLKKPSVTLTKFMLPGEQTTTIICKVSNFYPEDISIQWESKGSKVNTMIYTNSPPTCTEHTCSALSLLRTSQQDDIASYKCVVQHRSLLSPLQQNISGESEQSPIIPDAKILRPCFRDLFLNKTAEVSCRTNVPATKITWVITEGAKNKSVQGNKNEIILSGVKWEQSTITVLLQEWKKISYVTCELKSTQDIRPKHLSIRNTYTTGKIKSPVVNVLPPEAENITSEKQLTLICLVKGFYPADLFVTWEVNGAATKKENPDPSEVSCDNSNQYCSFMSQLSIAKDNWLNRTIYTCQVAHIALENYIRINISAPIDKSSFIPTAEISKLSFKDLFLHKMADISCYTNVPNTSITWLIWEGENSTERIGIKTMFTIGGMSWEQRTINVSLQEWKKISNLTCEVRSFQNVFTKALNFKSSYTAEAMKLPVVRLLPPATESRVAEKKLTLICLVKGFYPGELAVFWEVNGTIQKDVPDTGEICCDQQIKSCSTISQLSIRRTEWLKRTSYKCMAAHISTDGYITESIMASTEHSLVIPIVKIFEPSFKDLFLFKTANISCRTNVASSSIKWMADGKPKKPLDNNELSTHNNTMTWTQSTIQVTLEDWKRTSNITCEVESPQNVFAEPQLVLRTYTEGGMKNPVVHLVSLTPESLLCLVKGFYPGQLFVSWQMTNSTIQEDEIDPSEVRCDHQNKHCTYVSQLSIIKDTWLSGMIYTCQVAHVSSENYIRKNISINSDIATPVVIYCEEEGEDLKDVEDGNNVWPTASTFIALFLLTLIYSSFVTFVKVK